MFGGWTGIRTHALGTTSVPNEALQTLTSQGQTPCLIATILERLLGRTIANTVLHEFQRDGITICRLILNFASWLSCLDVHPCLNCIIFLCTRFYWGTYKIISFKSTFYFLNASLMNCVMESPRNGQISWTYIYALKFLLIFSHHQISTSSISLTTTQRTQICKGQ